MKFVFSILLVFCFLFSTQAVKAQSWPFGKADFTTVTVSSTDSTARATISNNLTVLDLGTLTKAPTLNLDLPKKVRAGSMLLVKFACGATAKNVTFGDYLQSPVITGVSNKGKYLAFIFDGAKFFLFSERQYN